MKAGGRRVSHIPMKLQIQRPGDAACDAQYQESRKRFLKFLARIAGDGALAEDALHESWLYYLSENKHLDGSEIHVADSLGGDAMRFAHRMRRRARREAPVEIHGDELRSDSIQDNGARSGRDREPFIVLLRIVAREMQHFTREERAVLAWRLEQDAVPAKCPRARAAGYNAMRARWWRMREKLRNAAVVESLHHGRPVIFAAYPRGIQEQLAACRMVWRPRVIIKEGAR